MDQFPVKFSDWFSKQFPDPSNWYRASQRYIRSLAVKSMMGYVFGLRERHSQNLLVDVKT